MIEIHFHATRRNANSFILIKLDDAVSFFRMRKCNAVPTMVGKSGLRSALSLFGYIGYFGTLLGDVMTLAAAETKGAVRDYNVAVQTGREFGLFEGVKVEC